MNVKKECDDRGISSSSSGVFLKSNTLKSRRGQVTAFIIVGILLLFVFAGVMYLVKVTKKTSLLVSEETQAKIPAEFEPLARYTENCLEQLGKRGLSILGQQGGYIYPNLVGKYSATDATDADGILLEPLQVPYWHYNKAPNQGKSISFASLQPKLYAKEDSVMSIEAQLSRFVEEKLVGCLQDYAPFREQGFTVLADAAKEVEVRVGEERVSFVLRQEVTASRGEAEHVFDSFVVRIPLKLKQYYELAARVVEAQQKVRFLESQMLSLLGSFASLDGPLPPTKAFTFDLAGTRFWTTEEVKKNVKSIISSYVPLLQVQSARNLQYYDYPVTDLSKVYQQNYDNMIIPLEGADEVAVRFDYFGWDPFFDVNDKQGVITSQDVFVKEWFVALGSQEFDTAYDVSYPLLITIDDPLAFGNQGYQFSFALEANIRNNRIVRDEQILPEPVVSFQESMACNENQRQTELVKAVVVDSFSKEPLETVRLGFTIPNQDDCTMGLTDAQGTFEGKFPPVYGGVLSLVKEDYLTNFYPLDTYALKDRSAIIGYAVADLPQPAIEMHKFHPLNISVKKRALGKCVTPLSCQYTLGPFLFTLIPYKDIACTAAQRQCFFPTGILAQPKHLARLEVNGSLSKYNDYYFLNSPAEALEENEQVIITLTRVGDVREDLTQRSVDEEYTIPILVKGNTPSEAKLVPGKYKVEAQLVRNEEIVIPREERSIQFDIITFATEERYEMNESRLEKYMDGQLRWDGQETYLTVTPEDLYTNKGLTFFLPSQEIQDVPEHITTTVEECGSLICLLGAGCVADICSAKEISINGRVVEDLRMMGMMGDISKELRQQLQPRWG